MKKVKFLRDFYRNGSKHCKGDVVEFTKTQADELLKRGVVTTDLKLAEAVSQSEKFPRKPATKKAKEVKEK